MYHTLIAYIFHFLKVLDFKAMCHSVCILVKGKSFVLGAMGVSQRLDIEGIVHYITTVPISS